MKTTGNEAGVVVETWDNLSNIPLDKLIKLRDVAQDNRADAYKDYLESDDIVKKISFEISRRMIDR